MTHVVKPGTAKAAAAMQFARELQKAVGARDVTWNELERATGIRHTALDSYRRGDSMPRMGPATVLATVLSWPRLVELTREIRSGKCERCTAPFFNDGGNRKRYCSAQCRMVSERLRRVAQRNRQAGHPTERMTERRRHEQAMRLFRSGLRIAEEKSLAQLDAIAAMCNDCEPEGVCRAGDCPLRLFSPLPLAQHDVGFVRDRKTVIAASWTPERRAAASERSKKMHETGVITPLGFSDESREKAVKAIKAKAEKRRAGSLTGLRRPA
jgi:hypothetical protein